MFDTMSRNVFFKGNMFDTVSRNVLQYCALLDPCTNQKGPSRLGELPNCIPGTGARVVGVGSFVSGLADAPHTHLPFF